MTLTGCVGSEKESPMNWDYEKEHAEFIKKVDLWTNDMTTARCEEMRASAFTVLQKLRGCAQGVVTVEEALQATRELDCSAFDGF